MKKGQTKAQVQRRKIAAALKPPTRKPREYPIKLTLSRGHSINSKHYGPGEVTVHPGVAAVLMEQERNAAREEAQFRDKDPLGTLIIAGQKLLKVPGAQFDHALVHGPVIQAIQG